MSMDPVVGPAVAGASLAGSQHIAAKMAEEMGIITTAGESSHQLLAQIEQHLKAIREHFVNENVGDAVWPVVLGDQYSPTKLEKHGRKFQSIFTPVAITNVVFSVMGLQPYVVASLPAGWSFTPFPDQTLVYLQAGGTQAQVLFLASDEIIGVAI